MTALFCCSQPNNLTFSFHKSILKKHTKNSTPIWFFDLDHVIIKKELIEVKRGMLMRTETEMLKLILDTAKKDERIRAVIMNGSRANPNAPKDMFQDYDIVYVVSNLKSFTSDHSWIDLFGKRIMLQMPETMRSPLADGRFIYLMLFGDGTRIDLQLIPTELYTKLQERDSESILLLDKDGFIPPFPPENDEDYHVKPPTLLEYSSCCNNFWWCTQNVAKGIWRDELSYSMDMLHAVVKAELHFMMEWYIGIHHEFHVSVGKQGKYFKRTLDEVHYKKYTKLYSDSETIWNALSAACDLFREFALFVGAHFAYDYPLEDDKRMTAYLEWVKHLPHQ